MAIKTTPKPSQDEMMAFSEKVGKYVEEFFHLTDGDDLCFNLLESGMVNTGMSLQHAGMIVAQHLEQA